MTLIVVLSILHFLAGPFTIDDDNRGQLIELILKDLSILAKLPNASGKSRVTSKGMIPYSS